MVNTTPAVIATRQLQQIPFNNLIGAPLNAAIEAQAKAATTSVEFIQSVGLQQDPDSGAWEAITVAFTYQDSQGVTRNLVVPLLSIVPIPYIGIDTIDIDFKANISASSSTSNTTTKSEEFSTKLSAGANYWFVKVNFEAAYSSKKDSTATAESKYSVEYTMDVSVHASQANMPAGLATVLNILSNSITSRDPQGNLVITLDKQAIFNAVGEKINVSVVVVNGDNKGVAKVTPTVTSSDTALVTASAPGETDIYGQTTFELDCVKLVDAGDPPKAVEISVELVGASATLKDSFTVTVN